MHGRQHQRSDVVVTTGGASVGRADFAKKALEGASRSVVRFGRLHMKPGKPTTFATLDANSFSDDVEGEKRWAFALPGNPAFAPASSGRASSTWVGGDVGRVLLPWGAPRWVRAGRTPPRGAW